MPNYSSNLTTWGSTGTQYPNGYQYEAGEQPVDGWDNFFNYNVIEDINHLIDVTNNDLIAKDGSVAMEGQLDMGGHIITGTDGFKPVSGEIMQFETGNPGNILIQDNANGEFMGGWVEGVGLQMFAGNVDLRGSNLVDSTGEKNEVKINAGTGLTGGGSTPLGTEMSLDVDTGNIDHSNLAGVTSDAHHARYTDQEAVNAVGGTFTSESGSQAISDAVHSDFSETFSNTYTDAAMTFGFGNPNFSSNDPIDGTLYAGFNGWQTSGGDITGAEFYLVNQTSYSLNLNWELFGLEA